MTTAIASKPPASTVRTLKMIVIALGVVLAIIAVLLVLGALVLGVGSAVETGSSVIAA